MPRGRNYVNQNKGVTLQAPSKKKPNMEQCFYGAGCTRKDCIYRHDATDKSATEKRNEPCMAYLAGKCTFSSKGCRSRHPSDAECEKLIARYGTIQCRHGAHCKTDGCLYLHPGDVPVVPPALAASAFPPLGGSQLPGPTTRPLPSAWRPSPPPRFAPMQQQPQAPISMPLHQPPQEHGAGQAPIPHAYNGAHPANAPAGQEYGAGQAPYPPAYNGGYPANTPATVPVQPPQATNGTTSLNVKAKAFVPGNF